jgi:transposase
MFLRVQRNGDRQYLLIVENQWIDGKVKQHVCHRLGRLDRLQASGQLDQLMLSLQRFSDKLAVLGAVSKGSPTTISGGKIGPPLIFERLWRRIGMPELLGELLAERKFEFPVERAVFLTVLHRLMAPSTGTSDRAAEKWREDYRVKDTDNLQLHHLYRAMAWLGEQLPRDQQADATFPGRAPRCIKDQIEEQLFARRRDLFTDLSLVFFDTTSIYFEGEGGETIGQRGFSKDHRPDLKQMVVGMVLADDGTPICSEIWPGNVADVTTLLPVIRRLKGRFGIGQVCVVADRGMISDETIRQIESKHLDLKYILGARMRSDHEVRDLALGWPGRYQQVHGPRQTSKDPSPLAVKDVRFTTEDDEPRRYIVCHNQEQAAKDRADREAILAGLADKLKQGDKALVGNKGFRKYLKAHGRRFEIDKKKVRDEARFDGKWVLRTNWQEAEAAEVALQYKQLWRVEAIFRTMKSVLETRPIYHRCDETIRGHVFCSFLALVLRKTLEDRLADAGLKLEWADVLRDLDALQQMTLTVGEKHYGLRTEARGVTGKLFTACGVGLPPTIREVEA